MSDKFKKIDDFNDILSGINTLALSYLQVLSELDNIGQDIIDDYCIRISEQINEALDKKRTELISGLTKSYTASLGILQEAVDAGFLTQNDDGSYSITTIPNPTDIDEVLDIVQKITPLFNKVIKFVAGPYATVAEFITILTPKLITLTTNINNLANIKDSIPLVGDYNYDKLNIYVKPISIEDIIGSSEAGGTEK